MPRLDEIGAPGITVGLGVLGRFRVAGATGDGLMIVPTPTVRNRAS